LAQNEDLVKNPRNPPTEGERKTSLLQNDNPSVARERRRVVSGKKEPGHTSTPRKEPWGEKKL
jgi:hypothetical protein